ncbi:MAG: glycosyltransferase family 4 protein [Clostridia bacterium]|nr:glycosyltransferase family 4 protein [Clostridia bacterium]
MNILVMANFKAECSGNFINSLLALGEKAHSLGWQMTYMFPLRDDGTQCPWTDYMRDRGFEVITYSETMTQKETEDFLVSVVEKYGIDLIHSHFSCLATILLWNKTLHDNVRILFHDHMDFVPDQPVFGQIRKQLKTAKRYREYGIGVISVMKKKHRGYFCVPNRWYIPNGITYQRNVKRSLTREEKRAQLGIGPEDRLCLFLGWDIYRKGVDIAIKAALKAREQGAPLIMGIVGFGADPKEEYLSRIRAVLGFDPMAEGIRFLESEEDMYALHRAADVYLSASRTEVFSYGILEAISENVPVVASDISGTRWCLKYSKSIKFPSGNIEKCADALIKAGSLRDLPSNRDLLTDRYSIDVWTQRVTEVYKEMAAEKRD